MLATTTPSNQLKIAPTYHNDGGYDANDGAASTPRIRVTFCLLGLLRGGLGLNDTVLNHEG